jgi:hypothetical protein
MRIHRDFTRPISLAFLLTMCLLSSSGCGNSEKVVPVQGIVTHKGQPVAGLVISFVPQNATETGVSTGETDESGKYSLKVVKSGKSGAVVGTHKVWVSRPRAPFVEPSEDKEETSKIKRQKMKEKAAAAKPPPDLAEIIKKYGSLDKSTLIKEVKGGESIDLTLD